MKFREAKVAIKGVCKQFQAVLPCIKKHKFFIIFFLHYFLVASELLEVYLARKSLPFKKQMSARTYLSADGKVSYDAYAIGEVHNPTYVFGISADNKHSTTRGLETPSFKDVVANAPIEQPSITNIIHVKDTGLVVFKAFLHKSLSTMARSNIPREGPRARPPSLES